MDVDNYLSYGQIVLIAITIGFATLIFVSLFSNRKIRIKFGPIDFIASRGDVDQAKSLIIAATEPTSEPAPYEREQLAGYYAQVLAQSKIAFWFSLIFATIGFFIIIIAALNYKSETAGISITSAIAGIVMDLIAALFFNQSRNAHKLMITFFDKLRSDRSQVEASRLCECIADEAARDALRIQLSLYYSGVDNFEEIGKSIIQECFSKAQDS